MFCFVLIGVHGCIGADVMDNIDTKIEHIFETMPAWSVTIDPNKSLDCDSLKLSSLTFLEALPEIRERYRFTKKSLKTLEDAGLPMNLVSMLDSFDESTVYNTDELSEILAARLGGDSKDKYELLIRKHTEIWRVRLKEYSDQYCFPKLNEAKGSALYLFLRVIFQLPKDHPIDDTKVFGGWIHPSVGVDGNYFNLSWPVTLESDGKTAVIHGFDGYFGKGYDGVGEYDYFSQNFTFRNPDTVRRLRFRSP